MKLFWQYYKCRGGDSINAMFGYHWDRQKNSSLSGQRKMLLKCWKSLEKLESSGFIGIDQTDPQKKCMFPNHILQGGRRPPVWPWMKQMPCQPSGSSPKIRGITKLLHKYHQTKGTVTKALKSNGHQSLLYKFHFQTGDAGCCARICRLWWINRPWKD